MELRFFDARNGQITCSADGRYLHSSFNPQVEAERFVKSLPHSFTPSAIIMSGACLPWCTAPLREQFPGTTLIAVQFDRRFDQYEAGWDNVFYVTDTSQSSEISLATELFNLLGEEKLVTSQFISWKAAEAVWPDEQKTAWKAIKSCMEKAQSVLTTRNYFNMRWFKNTVRSLSSIQRYAHPEKTDKPVLVTASGPSLSAALPFIRENRRSFLLIAASSSITTLLSNDIVPDACISTDGGFYATRHLRSYQTDARLRDVPLIISAESAVPSPLFDYVPFVLLTYGDAIETILAQQIDAPSLKGLRNGTVSGTAAAFAASLTTGNVYMCGLDLAPGKGFQHAEPNENDVPLFTGQTRMKTLETAQAASRYGSGSLALYREWFSTQNTAFTSRVFRLVSEKEPLEPLGTMKDICFETLSFESGKKQTASSKNESFTTSDASKANKASICTYLSSVADYIEAHPADEKCSLWYASLIIKDYVDYMRTADSEKSTIISSLAEKAAAIIREVAAHV